MSGARKSVVSMLVMAALATTGVAAAQTGAPQAKPGAQAAKQAATGQVVAGGGGGAQLTPSVTSAPSVPPVPSVTSVPALTEQAPPVQLGRAWAVVLADARQQLDALTSQALDASAKGRAVEAEVSGRDAPQAEVRAAVEDTAVPAAQVNETTLSRWDEVQVFGEPLLFRARGTTFGRWDAGVVPAVGVRFPLPR